MCVLRGGGATGPRPPRNSLETVTSRAVLCSARGVHAHHAIDERLEGSRDIVGASRSASPTCVCTCAAGQDESRRHLRAQRHRPGGRKLCTGGHLPAPWPPHRLTIMSYSQPDSHHSLGPRHSPILRARPGKQPSAGAYTSGDQQRKRDYSNAGTMATQDFRPVFCPAHVAAGPRPSGVAAQLACCAHEAAAGGLAGGGALARVQVQEGACQLQQLHACWQHLERLRAHAWRAPCVSTHPGLCLAVIAPFQSARGPQGGQAGASPRVGAWPAGGCWAWVGAESACAGKQRAALTCNMVGS